MNRICLSSDGLFPTVGSSGLSVLGLPVGGTLQGEGVLCGVPSLFLRLAGCNLRCVWRAGEGTLASCDTPHALQTTSGEWYEVSQVAERILHNLGGLKHLVITGGEPVMQSESLVSLLDLVRAGLGAASLHITLESNGTLFSAALAERVDLVSLSPKLNAHGCGYRGDDADYVGSIQSWLDASRGSGGVQLKFVVGESTDDAQIEAQYLSRLSGWERFPILVMPLGSSREELARHARAAVSIAIRRGWRYTPRLHIDLWGSRSGV